MRLRRKAKKLFRTPLLVISVAGLLGSLAAHIEAIFGLDPRHTFREMWVFQLALLVVLVPLIIEIFRKKSFAKILTPSRRMKYLIYTVLAYYAVNFYWFLYWAAEHMNASMTWRVVSAGWLLLFLIAAAFYGDERRAVAS
ncbi:MAG: hypothetical protein JO051_05780 [Acidobacteriaceae bacterium]|nr:hypothetical protein [Acidobacteriaceae bacterium]